MPSYVKVPLCAELPVGGTLRGFAYVMTAPRRARDPRAPLPSYLARIRSGYAQHGIAPDDLHAALARAATSLAR